MMISRPLSRRGSLLGLGAAIAAFYRDRGARAAPALSGGLVILTVGGLVGAPNRGPFDAKRDRFLDHSNLSFEKARVFTVADLAGLPQRTVTVGLGMDETHFKGPLLGDVLAAASPMGGAKLVRLSALDGYAAELTLNDIGVQQWVLALEADGNAFGIGDFGPLYAVRQLAPGEKKTEEEGAKWVFSIYYIELMV
jgi:hypothetical protein